MSIIRGFELHVAKSTVGVVLERWKADVHNLPVLQEVSAQRSNLGTHYTYLLEELANVGFVGCRGEISDK